MTKVKRPRGGQFKPRPWEALGIGDSLFLPGWTYDKARKALWQFMHRDPLDRSFVAREMRSKGEAGVRIWRLADGARPPQSRRKEDG